MAAPGWISMLVSERTSWDSARGQEQYPPAVQPVRHAIPPDRPEPGVEQHLGAAPVVQSGVALVHAGQRLAASVRRTGFLARELLAEVPAILTGI
jgi:hypothetical protein